MAAGKTSLCVRGQCVCISCMTSVPGNDSHWQKSSCMLISWRSLLRMMINYVLLKVAFFKILHNVNKISWTTQWPSSHHLTSWVSEKLLPIMIMRPYMTGNLVPHLRWPWPWFSQDRRTRPQTRPSLPQSFCYWQHRNMSIFIDPDVCNIIIHIVNDWLCRPLDQKAVT